MRKSSRFLYLLVIVRRGRAMNRSAHTEVREQLEGVCSLFSPCGFRRSDSGHWARQQAPYPTALSH